MSLKIKSVIAKYLLPVLLMLSASANAQLTTVANDGWAGNSVNVVIFRKNSLVTFKDTQFTAYYDQNQVMVLAKRAVNATRWQVVKTSYKGDATDAHKSISIMCDGQGYLHVAWGLHNQPLNYARSVMPGSLQLTEKMPMLDKNEERVTYPEFYRLPGGDLLFFYRDGKSGNGNLVLNKYSASQKKWKRVLSNLIDGEGRRNAYWQLCIDKKGVINISWVWRESPNVASNHDLCYARSADGGVTWQKSTGESYQLPITESKAEYALHIPQNSELINQTSMTTDNQGRPYIATYWRDSSSTIPQYHLVYKTGGNWQVQSLNSRKLAFSLSGVGTKSIPASRPQILVWNKGKKIHAALIFRDLERGNKVSMALNKNLTNDSWEIEDLLSSSVGSWEPTYDTGLWADKKVLNLLIQNVEQVDGEGMSSVKQSSVQVLKWVPGNN
ncbi:BNR repeat-containing protein [Mucilaginibacter sp.]|uniref:BNR repeat-containing protein n=1 Tax=Mucilaginibacter sp. TaxID=1882438 RepID=UPI0035668D20